MDVPARAVTTTARSTRDGGVVTVLWRVVRWVLQLHAFTASPQEEVTAGENLPVAAPMSYASTIWLGSLSGKSLAQAAHRLNTSSMQHTAQHRV